MQPPLVSVLTFPYNKNKYAIEALESLQKQSYTSIEHIIIDDCSKDNTADLLTDWIASKNHPCTFIKHAENQGLCKSFNEAVDLAKGKYITFLSDDLWEIDRLKNCVGMMESVVDQQALVLFSNALKFSEAGGQGTISTHTILQENNFPNADRFKQQQEPYIIIDGQTVFESLFYINSIFAPTFLINKSIFSTIGKYDESLYFEDYDFLFRAALHTNFIYANNRDVHYRISETGTSGKGRILLEKSILQVLDKHRDEAPNDDIRKALKRNYFNTAASLIALLAAENRKAEVKPIVKKYLLPNFTLSVYSAKKLLRFLYNCLF